MSSSPYTNKYYERITQDSLNSARVLLPLAQEILNPKSVLDVGCGSGAFLHVWQELGVKIIKGVDGNWVSGESLLIDSKHFESFDLSEPINLNKKFDIVTSFEVAEHIEKAKAEQFVQNLTRHANVILFSAAIPHQGGTHHVNEQWQSYWAQLFDKEGYVPFDIFRKNMMGNKNVAYYYAQNTVLFVKSKKVDQYEGLNKKDIVTELDSLNLVHPALYSAKAAKAARFDKLTRFIPWSVKRVLLKIFKR